jgi:UDP-N-acetylglucosamine--N-acetylmuramyl-(pentapeptide) pyrophosphoryl-undecaprenol N-acetylglucosamine transferase
LGLDLLLFPFKLVMAIAQSLPLVSRSETVVGFGGYVATPIFIAARIMGRRIIVHEANALPGFANRLGKALGAECFANFEKVGAAWSCPTIGMPLREEIIELARTSERKDLPKSQPQIMVMGGSQGSARINQVIWDALPHLDPSLRILHAVGEGNFAQLPDLPQRDGYKAVGYIESTAKAYREADLVIARAGAVTCAEILALGKRAILIPLGHGNGEQKINAEALVSAGTALSVEDSQFTREWLTANIDRALSLSPKQLSEPRLDATRIMAESIVGVGGPKR